MKENEENHKSEKTIVHLEKMTSAPTKSVESTTDDQTDDDDEPKCYIAVVGNSIVDGPPFSASDEVIREYFESARKYNLEQGKEVVRIYGPER